MTGIAFITTAILSSPRVECNSVYLLSPRASLVNSIGSKRLKNSSIFIPFPFLRLYPILVLPLSIILDTWPQYETYLLHCRDFTISHAFSFSSDIVTNLPMLFSSLGGAVSYDSLQCKQLPLRTYIFLTILHICYKLSCCWLVNFPIQRQGTSKQNIMQRRQN